MYARIWDLSVSFYWHFFIITNASPSTTTSDHSLSIPICIARRHASAFRQNLTEPSCE
ncbi:NADPH oxidase 4 [Gossypium arboreum]|uniref:NADPH oxidase 4 n=1 Tax=Gossypium arboreum TaxID=29729 RepID=A0A0B0PRH1_GOSAR|nr:NADPH oxidase 4 [Gossypium arboreum]